MRKGCHARVTRITANCSLCFILRYSLVRSVVRWVFDIYIYVYVYNMYTNLYVYLYTCLPMGIHPYNNLYLRSLCIKLVQVLNTNSLLNTNVIVSEDKSAENCIFIECVYTDV